jgi:ketosteroid isomerase-like protein
MKMRLLLTLTGLAIGFAAPALAQEQNTVDPEVRQQIEAAVLKFDEEYNKNDAAATAALYTQDAVEVWSGGSAGGLASGQQAIEKRHAVNLASSPGKLTHKLVQVNAIGNEICAIG